MSGERRKQFNAIFLAAIMLASVVTMSGAFVGSAAAQPVREGGTEIYDWNDLNEIQDNSDQSYTLMNDLDANTAGYNKVVKKENGDLVNNGDGFKPIGEFSGTFDGNGHTISDFETISTNDNVGLFSKITVSGVVKDVTLEGSSVKSTGKYVGILSGQLIGTAQNINIIDSNVQGRERTGGIAGRLGDRTGNNGLAENIDVSQSTSIKSTSGFAGGIIGLSDGGRVVDAKVGAEVRAERGVGGVIGLVLLDSTIINSEVTGKIIGTETTDANGATYSNGQQVGGLVGDTISFSGFSGDLIIRKSYVNAKIRGTADVGGVLGNDVNGPKKVEISETYSRADIKTASKDGEVVHENIGGLVGKGAPKIRKSYSASDITTGVDGSNDVVSNVGGIAGSINNEEQADFTNAYFDKNRAVSASVGSGSPSGSPLTTGNMQGETAFSNLNGFDFTNTWVAQQGDYPELRQFYQGATVTDVSLSNPSGKQLDLSVTTTGDISESNLVVQLGSSTDSTDTDVTIADGDFSETDNGDGSFTYDATVTADVSSGNTKSYQAVVDLVDNDPDPANALPTSESLDVSVASIGTDGSTTINTGSTTVSSANIQSNADTSGGGGEVTTSVSNNVPTTGSQSRQNLEEDVSSVDENAQVVSAVNINPSNENVRDSSATLEFTLSRSNVGEPSNIRVVRFNDNTNSYESLPTSVISTTRSEVTAQAQTPGFSLFAIVETAESATVSPEPIESDPLNITADSDTIAVGENVTLTVTNDATGEPVADAAVELPNQTVRTNANGSVTVSFNTTGDLTLRTTGNIDASYSPDSLTLTVTEAETPSGSLIPLNLTADSESVVVGEELTLSVTNAETGEPVADLPVALPNETVQTNANGNATVSFTATGNVTVETAGASDTYESDSLTIAVESAGEVPEPIVGDPVSEYDDDGDGTITAGELGDAVTAFGQGELSASELGDVVTAFGQS